jgi:LysR family transcriptional regulator, glycine cleavage system transcriptional activator
MNARDPLRLRSAESALPSRKALPPLEALRAFDAIARLGGIRKAAQFLCRDHAVVSRHLRTIEAWTGTRLVERTCGGAVLTEEGLRYHCEIAAAMDNIANATVSLVKRADRHTLHILCMPGFAAHWLASRLGDFQEAHPEVDVQLRPATRGPELLADDADVEIRLEAQYGTPLQLGAGLRSTAVARVPIFGVASRRYLASAPLVRHPQDLLRHQLLHEENFDRWRNWLAAHGVHAQAEIAGPRMWQVHLTLDAARHGRGIALTNSLVAAADLAEGRLVEVGADCSGFMPRVEAVYHLIAKADRWDRPLMLRFRQWLISTLDAEHPQLRVSTAA